MKSPSVALLTFYATGVSSFSANCGPAVRNTNTALHLLPTQGNQLAAACNAALAKEGREEEGGDAAAEEEATPTNAARQFVARLFSLPSRMQRSTSASSVSELASMASLFDPPYDRNRGDGDEKDIVLYPITGFRWVKVVDEYKVLPTTANAALNLPGRQEEELVGWFSPACKLGSLYSLDDSDYSGTTAESSTLQ